MKKNKYLIVKGCAGMGNRLFTICAAIEYCRENNRILFVDWSDGLLAEKGTNVFNKYFEIRNVNIITDWPQIQEIDQLLCSSSIWKNNHKAGIYDLFEAVFHPFFRKIPKRLIPKGRCRMIHGYWRKKKDAAKSSASFIDFLSGIMDKRNFPFGGDMRENQNADLLFYADFVPPYSEETFLENVFLQSEIRKKINDQALKWELDKNTIGVNVRSTDKKPFNKIEVLFDKIAALKLPQPKIFLATDNKNIQAIFKERFPGLFFYERFLPDVTTEGIHTWSLFQNKPEFALQILDDSINELWLLSKCQYLFYQGNSSFSILARMLHADKGKAFDWDIRK